jgi:hypothetical protein
MASGEEHLNLAVAQRIETVDPHSLPIVFVDWIITGGMHNNVVNVTLGTLDHSQERTPDDMPKAVVAAQLRFTRTFAEGLHRMLSDLLAVQTSEPAQQNPAPPKNRIN